MPRVRPGGDHRHGDIGQLPFVDDKFGSAEERADSRPQQDRPQDAVQQQEYLIGLFSQEISLLRLVFIRYSLQDKASQDQHPHPVGSAEAGRIEQREGGEERTSESNQSRKGKLPLTPGRVQQHLLLQFGFANREKQRLPPLYEKQEYQ